MSAVVTRPLALFVFGLLVSFTGCSRFASQGVNVDGVRMHQRGDHQAAADRFRQAIAKDPAAPDGYYNLAATLHQMGRTHRREIDLRQAENLYNQCLERDSNHVECYRGLAVLLRETGRTDAAFRLLQGWKELNPGSPDACVEMARLLHENGDIPAAKGQLTEALARDPYNSRALTSLGRIRDEAGEYAQALEDYRRSLAVNHLQPQVRDRVATLQATFGLSQQIDPTLPQDETRVVQQPGAMVRY